MPFYLNLAWISWTGWREPRCKGNRR